MDGPYLQDHVGYGSAGLVGPPYGPMAHVAMQRRDGCAQVAISSGLTPEAALKLETFLRALIEEDRPAMASLQARSATVQAASLQRTYAERAAQDQLSAGNWRDA